MTRGEYGNKLHLELLLSYIMYRGCDNKTMSRHGKTLGKITSRPVPAGIKWKEIKALLLSLGYEQKSCGKTGGSRRKFYHRKKDDLIICHRPHPEPTIDKGCVSDIARHLKKHGFTTGRGK